VVAGIGGWTAGSAAAPTTTVTVPTTITKTVFATPTPVTASPRDWVFWGRRRDIENLRNRAKERGYIPPPLKYPLARNIAKDRDLMELLLDPEKTALVNIDVQNAFADPEGKLFAPKAPEILPNINKLVKYFREHNMPIIWVQFTVPRDGSDIGLMAKYWPLFAPPEPYCAEGSWEWQLHPELDARPEDIYVKKPKYNAFWGSNLEAVLKSLAVQCLVFTGLNTDMCVGTTMIHGMHWDYICVMAEDAIQTFSPYHEAFLDLSELLWSRVLTTDEVIAELDALKP
jgi:ureidoacrylate peracid hydrolase